MTGEGPATVRRGRSSGCGMRSPSAVSCSAVAPARSALRMGRSASVRRGRPVGLSGRDGDRSVPFRGRGGRRCPCRGAAAVSGVFRRRARSSSLPASCWPGAPPRRRTGPARTPAAAAADWLNRTYTLTCDGIVPDGFPATVVDGGRAGPGRRRRLPYYDHYDIRVTGTASGDVDGDGAPDTVVLLECSPQPSNGIVQEVQVFSSTGRPLGEPPQPAHPAGGAQRCRPSTTRRGCRSQHGEIVAAMTAYGPDDFHASGPSVPLTVRWRFDGQRLRAGQRPDAHGRPRAGTP